jgi:hypothetical protein
MRAMGESPLSGMLERLAWVGPPVWELLRERGSGCHGATSSRKRWMRAR